MGEASQEGHPGQTLVKTTLADLGFGSETGASSGELALAVLHQYALSAPACPLLRTTTTAALELAFSPPPSCKMDSPSPQTVLRGHEADVQALAFATDGHLYSG